MIPLPPRPPVIFFWWSDHWHGSTRSRSIWKKPYQKQCYHANKAILGVFLHPNRLHDVQESHLMCKPKTPINQSRLKWEFLSFAFKLMGKLMMMNAMTYLSRPYYSKLPYSKMAIIEWLATQGNFMVGCLWRTWNDVKFFNYSSRRVQCINSDAKNLSTADTFFKTFLFACIHSHGCGCHCDVHITRYIRVYILGKINKNGICFILVSGTAD